MIKAMIVSGGTPPKASLIKEYMDLGYDYIIAADNGAKTLIDLGIAFDLALGDFDSLPKEYVEKLSNPEFNKSGEVVRYNSEKDFTDTEGAYLKAKEYGAKNIVFLGATGTRYDHFIANIGILKKGLADGVQCEIRDGHNKLYLIEESRTIKEEPGFLSFSAIGCDVEGFNLENVKYPLKNHTLTTGDLLCVSNEFKGDAKVHFKKGIVLVMITND